LILEVNIVKIKKLVLGMVVFLFLFGFFSNSIHAEPNIPAPTAPAITTNPPVGQPPVPVSKNDTFPGQTQAPGQNAPIAPPPVPKMGIDSRNQPNPGSPVNPGNPGNLGQPGIDPNLNPGTPPIPPSAPVDNPIKGYQTAWYTSFWFLSTMVILLVIILLVIYSLKEGKPPSEEKEDMVVSKKKKNKK
jgi:hypothetical protein